MMSIVGSRKRVGRPPVGSTPINLRLPPDLLATLDTWIAEQDPAPSRPEAIRAILVEKLDQRDG